MKIIVAAVVTARCLCDNEDIGILGCYVIQLVSRYRDLEDGSAFIFRVKHSGLRETADEGASKIR
jgi:hypothetical protein